MDIFVNQLILWQTARICLSRSCNATERYSTVEFCVADPKAWNSLRAWFIWFTVEAWPPLFARWLVFPRHLTPQREGFLAVNSSIFDERGPEFIGFRPVRLYASAVLSMALYLHESVPKIIINNSIFSPKLHFGNIRPWQFPSAVW